MRSKIRRIRDSHVIPGLVVKLYFDGKIIFWYKTVEAVGYDWMVDDFITGERHIIAGAIVRIHLHNQRG